MSRNRKEARQLIGRSVANDAAEERLLFYFYQLLLNPSDLTKEMLEPFFGNEQLYQIILFKILLGILSIPSVVKCSDSVSMHCFHFLKS